MQKPIIFFVCIFMALFINGCATGRGTGQLVSDFGNGTVEHRAIQDEIKTGETELALTIARIETGLGELERSISASQGAEQEIGAIIQRVRKRMVDPALIEEWRNRQSKTNDSGQNAGS